MKENLAAMQGLSAAQQQRLGHPRCKENTASAAGYALRSKKPPSMMSLGEEAMEAENQLPSDGSPMPRLAWVQSAALWAQMKGKDYCIAAPETSLRLHHPSLVPSMRTILLDWMMEVRGGGVVCERERERERLGMLTISIGSDVKLKEVACSHNHLPLSLFVLRSL